MRLEIGVHEGRSSCWLLERILTHPDARAVDGRPVRFSGGDSESDREKHTFGPNRPANLRQRFFENLAPHADQHRHFEMFSDEFFAQGLPAQFELALIDGGHAGLQACRDLLHAWQRLKVGGRLVFDDYGWHGDFGFASDGPRRAMDAFLCAAAPTTSRSSIAATS